ncbi:MAG: YbjN domain-containing protein [Candidatus Eremiobacteraeota bacterium]|nr:YbjN domain-containing protein [Candidatus Eremiobacteraeota bacterium]
MDFKRLIDEIEKNTHCKVESTGNEENVEYTLTFKVDEDRKQDLVIYPFVEEGKEMVRIISGVGHKSDFSTNKLISFLELNMSLRHGAFAIYQGQVVLVATINYSNMMDVNRVSGQLHYLTKMADTFERTLVGLDRK